MPRTTTALACLSMSYVLRFPHAHAQLKACNYMRSAQRGRLHRTSRRDTWSNGMSSGKKSAVSSDSTPGACVWGAMSLARKSRYAWPMTGMSKCEYGASTCGRISQLC